MAHNNICIWGSLTMQAIKICTTFHFLGKYCRYFNKQKERCLSSYIHLIVFMHDPWVAVQFCLFTFHLWFFGAHLVEKHQFLPPHATVLVDIHREFSYKKLLLDFHAMDEKPNPWTCLLLPISKNCGNMF
jgi:hypothetical protein